MNIFYTQMLSHQGLSNNIFLLPKIVLICLALRTLKAIFMSYLLIPLSRATFYWWKRTDFSQRNSFLLLCLKLREWPFSMPCIEAEGTFTGYKNCTSSDPGIQHPRELPDQDVKNYFIYPSGHRVWNLPRNFLRSMKLFRPNLKNATFRTHIIMKIY